MPAIHRLTQRPRGLKVIEVKLHDANGEALLDSEAVPNIMSSSFCDSLSMRASQSNKKSTVANRDCSLFVGSLLEIIVSFAEINIAMDVPVMNGLLFDIILGAPALDALQACLDMGKPQGIISVTGQRIVIPFETALVKVSK